MTLEELLNKLETLEVPDNVCWKHIEHDLQALIRTETERCLAIVKRYAQQQADSYALGGPMPPDWMEAYDEILGPSPGKGGG